MSGHQGIPLSRGVAEEIAGRMIDAALLLGSLPDASHSNIERLVAAAEIMIDLAGDWVARHAAVHIWFSILEDAVIPLESTLYLPLAEQLLTDHDLFASLLAGY